MVKDHPWSVPARGNDAYIVVYERGLTDSSSNHRTEDSANSSATSRCSSPYSKLDEAEKKEDISFGLGAMLGFHPDNPPDGVLTEDEDEKEDETLFGLGAVLGFHSDKPPSETGVKRAEDKAKVLKGATAQRTKDTERQQVARPAYRD